VSRNFYWVPRAKTLFDWPNTDYTHTPPATFEDLSALRSLPRATVKVENIEKAEAGEENALRIRVTNTSKAVAFQLFVEATKHDGAAYEPLLWSDNFISLLPGEERELRATLLSNHDGTVGDPIVRVSGWNVEDAVVTPHLHVPR